MTTERLRFRSEEPRAGGPSLFGLIALLLIFAALAVSRPLWMPTLPEGALVEVAGEVPRPGTYLVSPPTVRAAVEAAGGTLDDGRYVPEGYVVVVADGSASIQTPDNPLLVALPVDLNQASAAAIGAIPGVGRKLGEKIVADRDAQGPFYALEDVHRVSGVGQRALDAMTPFVTLGEPGPRPPPALINPNTASAAELERLPGIGPVTAARIIVDREDRGPFRKPADLQRVSGIGPKTVEKLAPLVVFE